MAQIASGLKYLHDIGIIHRDLKLENIMMSSKADTAIPYIVDFGLSIILGPEQKKCEIYGTQGYLAPEMCDRQPYYKEVDLWSLGVLFYSIISGFMPFEQEDMPKIILMKEREDIVNFNLEQFSDTSDLCKDLIRGLLKVDSAKRL
jgi:calcium/calmodulin-dependent protein kinase I